MKRALYTGVFDPPTFGHIEILQRAADLFDELYVAIAEASSKGILSFTAEERKNLLRKATASLSNVTIHTFSGLAVDFCKKHQIDVLVRGLRNGTDFDYEYQMAIANRQMTGIETIFLMASPQDMHISSTLIREIASNGRRLHGFVPKVIEAEIYEGLSRPRVI